MLVVVVVMVVVVVVMVVMVVVVMVVVCVSTPSPVDGSCLSVQPLCGQSLQPPLFVPV